MAKALHHGRSLSLHSGSHPAVSQFNEDLSRFKASEASCSSLSKMTNKINVLKNLFDGIEDLLSLPHNQQIISREEKCIDQVLDEYIRLLDACAAVKDLVSHTKQDLRELLSALRRKDVHGVQNYLSSRRKSKKIIQKALKHLNTQSLEKDTEKMSLVYKLKDAHSVTISTLESLLSYAMGTKERKNGWSLVSKLMHSKKVSHQGEETYMNGFNKVDSFLQLRQENDTNVEEIVSHLKEMDSSIQILEEELECLFRQLIKTRVSILNILNH